MGVILKMILSFFFGCYLFQVQAFFRFREARFFELHSGKNFSSLVLRALTKGHLPCDFEDSEVLLAPLVGGFNPFEKSARQIGSSPQGSV